MTKNKVSIQYYPDSRDKMWNWEIEKLIPYLDGRGADIGCGTRSLSCAVIRVDLDPKKESDIVSSGDDLSFKDNELDFVYGVHSFEHLPDPLKTLNEWLRVVKPGGIVGIVHPDLDFTGPQKVEAQNPGLQSDPFNKHYHEFNQNRFMVWLRKQKKIGFEILDYGEACIDWSFFVILMKNKEEVI